MHCLICLTKISAKTHHLSLSKSQVDNHSYMLFVLRKVLQIPVDQVTFYLKECPNIENWFNLCANCNETVEKCKQWYDQLLQSLEKFNEFQEVVIANLKQSQKEKFDEKNESLGNEHFVTKAVRQLLSKSRDDPGKAPMILEINLNKPQNFCENLLHDNGNHSKAVTESISEVIVKQECNQVSRDNLPRETWNLTDNLQNPKNFEITTKNTKFTRATKLNLTAGQQNKRRKVNHKTSRLGSVASNSKKKSENRTKCFVCPATFSRRDNMNKHYKRTHLKTKKRVRIYACPPCNLKFENQSKLMLHQTTAHSKAHQCTKFQKTFSRRDKLNQHLKLAHHRL